MVCISNPSTGEVESGQFLRLSTQPAHLTWLALGQWEALLHRKGRQYPKNNTSGWTLASTCMFTSILCVKRLYSSNVLFMSQSFHGVIASITRKWQLSWHGWPQGTSHLCVDLFGGFFPQGTVVRDGSGLCAFGISDRRCLSFCLGPKTRRESYEHGS